MTIFGESAGGRNVMSLLLSPLAQGLFHRAIVQSGRLATTGLATASGFTDDPRPGHASSPQEVSLRLLVADGSAADRDAAREHLRGLSSNQVASWLRALSDRELLSAYRGELGMYDLPQIVRDGHVIPGGEPIAHLARRSYNRVPIILGSNRDENKLFMFASPEYVQRLFGIPLWLRDEARYNLLAEYQSKAWKISGVDRPAIVLADVQPGKVFAYRWDWDEEPNLLLADLSVMLGAAHALEIPFVFGHWELGRAGNVIFSDENEAGRLELSQAMMSYWAEFAYTGAPGRGRAGELPLWAAWENRNPTAKFMVLDTTAGGGLRMDGEALAKPYLVTLIDSDPRLPTQRDKCEIFFELVRGSGELSEAEYPRVGTKGCKDYPLEEYPWDG